MKLAFHQDLVMFAFFNQLTVIACTDTVDALVITNLSIRKYLDLILFIQSYCERYGYYQAKVKPAFNLSVIPKFSFPVSLHVSVFILYRCQINTFFVSRSIGTIILRWDLENKFQSIMGRTDFSDQIKMIIRYKCILFKALLM